MALKPWTSSETLFLAAELRLTIFMKTTHPGGYPIAQA